MYPVFAHLYPNISSEFRRFHFRKRGKTHMITTLATSSGTPSRCIGTLLAITSPGSDSFFASMSHLDVHFLYA